MGLFDNVPELIPSTLPVVDDIQLFTVDQVATAVAAAVTAHVAGDDPADAARNALSGQ